MADQGAVVVYSFGKRDAELEPNPCNRALGRAALKAIEAVDPRPLVITQWEIAPELRQGGIEPDLVIEDPGDTYLGSEEVWQAARAFLVRQHVRNVTPIAHPFLHLHKVTSMMLGDGFAVEPYAVGKIGFDASRSNHQWWTRGPLRLLVYAVAQRAVGLRG
jgi:hypothetical protein